MQNKCKRVIVFYYYFNMIMISLDIQLVMNQYMKKISTAYEILVLRLPLEIS